ncbi:MAG: complex I subunit 1 family protein [Actinomycetota bacterium]
MNPAIRLPLSAFAVLGAGLAGSGLLLYGLLKIHSRIMNRMGPMYAGRFHGIGQPIAEVLKPIQKEDIVPASADGPVFRLAPLVAIFTAFLGLGVIPIGPGLVAADTELGLFFVLAIGALSTIAIVMAAYGAQSKFTLIGGLRAVGQIIAYELPVVLGAVSVAMLAGSLNLTEIVQLQDPWYLPNVVNPLGAIVFVILLLASFAEVMWNPFDMPVAESEIVTGPLTEYSGMRFIFFYIAEFVHVVLYCALITILFFGGWNGPHVPFLPDALQAPLIFTGKMVMFGVFFIWVRFTMPRLREDQLQKLAWKGLIPLGLLNILLIALYKVGVFGQLFDAIKGLL